MVYHFWKVNKKNDGVWAAPSHTKKLIKDIFWQEFDKAWLVNVGVKFKILIQLTHQSSLLLSIPFVFSMIAYN